MIVTALLVGCGASQGSESDAPRGEPSSQEVSPEAMTPPLADPVPCVAAPETCNGIDDDCDRRIDEDPIDGMLTYADADGDGFGDPETGALRCRLLRGRVTNAADCDDGSAAAAPGSEEVCGDSVDGGCDGTPLPCRDYRTMLETVPTRWSSSLDGYDIAVAAVGDLDGDGWPDIALGDYGRVGDAYVSAAHIYGGPFESGDTRIGDRARATVRAPAHLEQPSERALAGRRLAAAGDVNGDGRADLLVQGLSHGVWLFHGPVDGYLSTDDAAATLPVPGTRNTGAFGVGDLDHDGFGDILFLNPGEDAESNSVPTTGAAWLVHGPIAGPIDEQDAETVVRGGAGFGYTAAPVGDLDGDGRAEVAIVDAWTGVIGVYGDLPSGVVPAGDAVALLQGDRNIQAGFDVAGGGDVDGDGFGDLLASAETSSLETRPHENLVAAWLVYGPFQGERSMDDGRGAVFLGETGFEAVQGAAVEGPGDMDADGFDDVVVGLHSAPTPEIHGAGAVAIWYGPVEGAQVYTEADGLLYGPGNDGHAWIAQPHALAAAGDVDGDGRADLLIGGTGGSDLPHSAAWLVLGGGW